MLTDDRAAMHAQANVCYGLSASDIIGLTLQLR